MKKLIIVIAVIIFALLLKKMWPDGYLHIIFCDVGQGDALVFSLGFTQLVVDVGENAKIATCLEENLPWWDRTLEVIAISHPDSDHSGGFSSVIDRYEVKHVLLSLGDYPSEINTYCFQHEKKCQLFGQGSKISFSNKIGDILVSGIWPPLDSRKNQNQLLEKPEANNIQTNSTNKIDQNISSADVNDYSHILNVEFGEVKMLLMGDVPEIIELSLDRHALPEKVQLIKIAHHGSKYSTSQLLIDKLRPEIALIGVGKNNRFGHPSTRVIDLLRYSNIRIFRTDVQGTIHLISDGTRIWLHPSSLPE